MSSSNSTVSVTVKEAVRAERVPRHVPDSARQETILERFLATQIFILIFGQKIGLPLGGDSLSLCVISFYVGLGIVLLYEKIELSPVRLALYSTFMFFAITGQLFCGREFSATSLIYIMLCHLPFVFVWRVREHGYRRIMMLMQDAMLAGAFMVMAQLAWQFVFGLGVTISMNRFMPDFLLVKGFIYEAPIRFGALFVRPNGFFFLEPSFVSLFLACAILIEVAYFRRVWRVLAYAAALVGSMGATGIVMLVVAAPWVLVRQSARVVLAAVIALVLAVLTIAMTGLADVFLGRLSELSSPTTSGWARLVGPILQLGAVIQKGENLATGIGAGNIPDGAFSAWPIVKLSIEYGMLTAIAFFVFLTACVIKSDNPPLALALFITFNFTGGYVSNPMMIFTMVLFTSTILPHGPRPEVHWTWGGHSEDGEIDQKLREGNLN